MEIIIANDGNGTFVSLSISELMDLTEDWGEDWGELSEEEWESEHGDSYDIYRPELVWHSQTRAVWDSSIFADPRHGAGNGRYLITPWPPYTGADVITLYGRGYWQHDTDQPSAEAVLRLIRMQDRKRRQQ